MVDSDLILTSEIEQQKASMPNSSVWQHTSSGFLDKYLYKLSSSKFVSLNRLHYDFPLFSIHITASNLTIKQCKYMSVWCKNLELDNYAKGLLELHFQLAILPSHLRVSLIQNRSDNSREQPNTNIQVDLCLEHENRRFKEQAKTYRWGVNSESYRQNL